MSEPVTRLTEIEARYRRAHRDTTMVLSYHLVEEDVPDLLDLAKRAIERAAAAEGVCRAADAYTDCIAEFAETAAGDLSAGACAEHLDALTAAVLAWKEAAP